MSVSLCFCKLLTYFRSPQLKQTAAVWQRGAFFSRRGKESESTEEEEMRRKIVPGEDKHLMKESLNSLASKTRTLTSRHPYEPPKDVKQRIDAIVEQLAGPNWDNMTLTDSRVKYKILARLIKEFGKDVPNATLSEMNSIEDAVEYFETPIKETSALDDLSKTSLPPNLHVQTEYLRFHPDTDEFFGGKTAYVGRDTVVTSIKYKRKYQGSKGTEEKPGYVNHYYGY